jgi:hypothetical protein
VEDRRSLVGAGILDCGRFLPLSGRSALTGLRSLGASTADGAGEPVLAGAPSWALRMTMLVTSLTTTKGCCRPKRSHVEDRRSLVSAGILDCGRPLPLSGRSVMAGFTSLGTSMADG